MSADSFIAKVSGEPGSKPPPKFSRVETTIYLNTRAYITWPGVDLPPVYLPARCAQAGVHAQAQSRCGWAREILQYNPQREEQMRADDRETEDRGPTPSPVLRSLRRSL